jgi:hypothetical protein
MSDNSASRAVNYAGADAYNHIFMAPAPGGGRPLFLGDSSRELSHCYLPLDWHSHEMLYGDVAAVCRLSADGDPEPTGRLPICGAP